MKISDQLSNKEEILKFYDDRYNKGYMDEWTKETKSRIFNLLKTFNLPDEGFALDYGCGNGVLTNLIKRALPQNWKIYGCEISDVAVKNAKMRYPECEFFLLNDNEYKEIKFDFVFTHHVLEHVLNLQEVIDDIDSRLKNKSFILHILPCGNNGSLEYRICELRINGIDKGRDNRFFFEDEGHLRRLTTEQLINMYKHKNFVLSNEYYSNQYFGGINWISQSSPKIIRQLVDLSSCINDAAKKEMVKLNIRLFLLWLFRYPASLLEIRSSKTSKKFIDYLIIFFSLPFYLFTKPLDLYLKKKTSDEWEKNKTDRNGSEMYLFFGR